MTIIANIVLTVMRMTNEFELNMYLYGLIAAIGTLFYCILEDYGWRRYLQKELHNLKQ